MPRQIIITNQQCVRRDGHVTCSAEYLVSSEEGNTSLLHRVAFRFAWDGAFTLPGGESFVTVGLFPAMKLGLPMVSEAPLAPGFVEAMDRLQDIIIAWFPGNQLQKIAIAAPARPLNHDSGRTTAALFSGGVDSFHTAHRHRSELDRLIYIDGFDTDLYQAEHRALVRQRMEAAATELGHPMTTVETDARLFLDKYVKWGLCATTVSGAVVQLFQTVFSKVYMASSHRWDITHILADGYLLSQQFGLADLKLVIDALDVNRHGKVATLQDCPAALRHLRVCWDMPSAALNCGQCEKCLRTMVALDSVGLLKSCLTFPHQIDWERIKTLDLSSNRHIRLWDMTRQMTGSDELRARLDEILVGARTRGATKRMWEAGKELSSATGWPVLARKLGKPMLATAWDSDPDWLLKKCRQHFPQVSKALWAALRKRKSGILKHLLFKNWRGTKATPPVTDVAAP